jgi:FRG domain-containing protein
MNERIVGSWLELQDLLFPDTWNPSLGRFRSNLAYRGGAGRNVILQPGLIKLGRRPYQAETHLLRAFRKYASQSGSSQNSIWNWLALAQHHGLPTRLLDWTYSPYVALHFATKNADFFQEDSHVFCIDYQLTNRGLPAKMRKILKQEGSSVFTAEMLEQVAKNLTELDSMSPKRFVAFFEPPSLDDRIVNQYSLFSLSPRSTGNLLEWLSSRQTAYMNLIIPAQLKREIRDKLDQANITERTLSPGLDGLCAWLKRYYGVDTLPD